MSTVVIQNSLSLDQIDLLLREFPHYLFLSLSQAGIESLDAEDWDQIEIFFGNSLSPETLEKARQLKWIHTQSDDINLLCIEKIEKRGNILLTQTPPSNVQEAAHFVIAAIQAFGKHLFHWKEATNFPSLIWDSKWKESMWKLSDKTLLQIGLGSVGKEVARQARESLHMRVLGVQETRSFQPCCDKTVAIKDLHSVLPHADVVVLSLPKDARYYRWFGEHEIALLKDDAILVIVESNRVIDEKALAAAGKKMNHLRGIVIDCYSATPISADSPLWKLPNIIITPDVAKLPLEEKNLSFQIFRHNLRQYLHGNFADMRGLINPNKPYLIKTPS